MNQLQKRFQHQSNTIYEVSNAVLQEPTNATFVSKEIIQNDAKKKGVRQTDQNVYDESKVAENKETKRQEKEENIGKTV